VKCGVFSADFVLPKYDAVIEINGPSHYVINWHEKNIPPVFKEDPTTKAKQRYLMNCGRFKHMFSVSGNTLEDSNMDELADKLMDLKIGV
jgi:hypothetical protein